MTTKDPSPNPDLIASKVGSGKRVCIVDDSLNPAFCRCSNTSFVE